MSLLRTSCCVAMLLHSALTLAQTEPIEVPGKPSLKTVSATQPGEPTDEKDLEATDPTASEPFQFPAEQHPWARFQEGAWRELQTVTEELDKSGHVISRNTTTQKEVLKKIEDGKYVLDVQTTVDLSSKRIVGAWKTRVLHLSTDNAGPMIDSSRLEDQSIELAGRTSECQVWELSYRDGARNLTNHIYYDAQRFPFVMRRETFINNSQANDSQASDSKGGSTVEVEQLMEIIAREVPYPVGSEFLNCAYSCTIRHRAKGDTQRLAYTSRSVPGGEVAVTTTDFDAQGDPVRWAVTTVAAFGETPSEEEASLNKRGNRRGNRRFNKRSR